MAEFIRSRLEKKAEEEITKKTIFLGVLTLLTMGLLVTFGLPLLIKFSVFLGNTKNNIEVKNNDLPPLPPRIVMPFDATNSGEISVKGLAEKNLMVELLKNDVSIGKVAVNESGDFTFDGIPLDEGESVFTAIAIDDKGVSSEPSNEVRVKYINKLPSLKMLNPSEDSLKVTSSDFDVIGQSDRGVSVLVNGSVAMVDDTGKFKIKLQLNIGNNQVNIEVRDIAGNVTRKTINITFDI